MGMYSLLIITTLLSNPRPRKLRRKVDLEWVFEATEWWELQASCFVFERSCTEINELDDGGFSSIIYNLREDREPCVTFLDELW